MFIRTRPYTLKNGEKRHGFGLVESRSVDGVTKHISLLNLGQDFAIPEAQWAHLTEEVETRLKGQKPLPFYEDDEAYQAAVDDIVQRLLDKGYDIHKRPNQKHFILPEKTTHPDSRTFAGERLALEALQQLGFPDLLATLGFSVKHTKLACALVVGRMLHPASERATHEWMLNRSTILELLDVDPPSLNTLYRVTDGVQDQQQQIMDGLYGNTQELLDFGETIVFYDLTNTFYHGKEKGELLRRGRSKDRRNDCPLVTLALVLDASGFPRSVQLLSGHISEPSTMQRAIEDLGGAKPTIIMDAGIATKKNLAYLQSQGLNWITVERTKVLPLPEKDPDVAFTSESGSNIRVWKLPVEDAENEEEKEEVLEEDGSPEAEADQEVLEEKDDSDEETFSEDGTPEEAWNEVCIYVHSCDRQVTEDQILETKSKKFLEEIAYLHEGLSIPRRMKNHDQLLVRIGRKKEAYKQVSHLYDIQVTKKDGTKNAESIIVTRLPAHEDRVSSSGGYVLRTSLEDRDLETIVRTYWRLTEIEATFRMMKSDLGLRPIYHSKDERIEGHLFITVLAYHLAHFVRTKCKAEGIHSSWATMRTELNRVHRITTRMVKTKTRYLITKIDQDLSPFLERLFKILGLRYNPNETRVVEEHVEEDEPTKPPDP